MTLLPGRLGLLQGLSRAQSGKPSTVSLVCVGFLKLSVWFHFSFLRRHMFHIVAHGDDLHFAVYIYIYIFTFTNPPVFWQLRWHGVCQ